MNGASPGKEGRIKAINEMLFEAIAHGNSKRTEELVREAIHDGSDVVNLLNETMIPAMREVGEQFSRHEIFVPDMLLAARAMQAGLTLIEPLLAGTHHASRARVCIGTVKGDLHDIGKNLVVMMLQGAGYEVDDIGVDCPTEKYEAAVERGASIVCLSALLTTTMPYMKTVVEALRAGNSKVKVVVGGAPVTREYADEIGAHGYGADANDAVKVVERLLATA